MKSIEEKVINKVLGTSIFDKIPEDVQNVLIKRIQKATIPYFTRNKHFLKSAVTIPRTFTGKGSTPRIILNPKGINIEDINNPDSSELLDGVVNTFTNILKEKYPINVPGNPKTVIAFSGGGIKGCFEAGALYYLSKIWDQLNVIGVVGASTGAINALVVSESGKFAASKIVDFYLAAESWRDFFNEEEWYRDLRITFQTLGIKFDLIEMSVDYGAFLDEWRDRVGNTALSAIFGAVTILLKNIIEAVIKIRDAVVNLKEIFKNILNAGGIINLDPLIDTISNQIDFTKIGQEIALRMYMVRYEDGLLYYMDEKGDIYNRDGTIQREYYGSKYHLLKTGVRASASIPVFIPATGFKLSEDGTEKDFFIDGGVRENMPLQGAKEMGAEQIISIVCAHPTPDYWETNPKFVENGSVMSYKEIPPFFLKNLLRTLEIFQCESVFNEINPPYGFNDDIKRVPIYAHEKVIDGFDLDPGLVRINIEDGYMAAYDSINYNWGEITEYDAEVLEWYRLMITGTRKKIWELEKNDLIVSIPRQIGPGGATSSWTGGAPTVNGDTLKQIRAFKYVVLSNVLARYNWTNENPECLPIKIVGSNGQETSIHSWWEGWERHGLPKMYKEVLETSPWDNPWNEFKISSGVVPAISGDQRPHTDLF